VIDIVSIISSMFCLSLSICYIVCLFIVLSEHSRI